jgi:ATP-dependent phosphoenolpyruvate carboxykinase
MSLHLLQQPVQKRLVFGLAGFGKKTLTQMPVRGVKDFHSDYP